MTTISQHYEFALLCVGAFITGFASGYKLNVFRAWLKGI